MKKIYITSKKFINPNITFGFFTRKGGVSKKKFSSLNCSYNSGDKDIAVKKNILIAKKKLSLDKTKLKLVNQVHSSKVVVINKKNFKKLHRADGIISQDKDISIAVLTADCCPVFLFDDDSKFISCIHVGWKGAYSNIIKSALDILIKIQPNNKKIKAVIGPCLNKKNFEVSEDFKIKFIKSNSNYKYYFASKKSNKKSLFDMRGLIKLQLLDNKINNIDNINIDTYSLENLFFSHRRSTHLNHISEGRMINIIGFNKQII